MQNVTQQQKNQINPKYKSERCRHFESHGNCILGNRCHFAHGDEELRKPEDPLTQDQLDLALKSVQMQNCNQANRGGGGKMGMGGGMRGDFKGGRGNGMRGNNGMGMRGGYKRGGYNNGGGRGGYQ